MNILAINPWVYDFTYYDLYAKPYGLLMLCTALAKLGHQVQLIDLPYSEHYEAAFSGARKKDGTGFFYRSEVETPDVYKKFCKPYYRFGLPEQYFIELLKKQEKPDLILVTSTMTYWYLGVKDTIKILKENFPDIPVYLGGIYATLLSEHAKVTTNADFVVKGSLTNATKTIIKQDMKNNFCLPDLKLFYNRLHYIPILTSLGCPFSCQYCASNLLYGNGVVYGDIGECYDYLVMHSEFFNTDIVAFYDDALLYKKETHLYSLLEKVIKGKKKFRFFTPNGLHIKYIDQRCAEILKASGFEKVRLSLEFVENKGYDNKTDVDEFISAVKHLHNAGFKNNEIGVYLLCGVVDQKAETVKNAIDFVYETGASPYLSEYSPVPGSQLFARDKLRSMYNLDEPLFQNNSILPLESDQFTYMDFLALKNYNRAKRRVYNQQ